MSRNCDVADGVPQELEVFPVVLLHGHHRALLMSTTQLLNRRTQKPERAHTPQDNPVHVPAVWLAVSDNLGCIGCIGCILFSQCNLPDPRKHLHPQKRCSMCAVPDDALSVPLTPMSNQHSA